MSSEKKNEQISQDIAVIGLAGRFPGAGNIAEFWRNLRDGVETITFFSEEELAAAGVATAVYNDPNYVPAKGILADIDLFDAPFFGYNPREAAVIDPQQRIFLECAWHALEHAGYAADRIPGAVGIFAGATMNTYVIANLMSNPQSVQAVGPYQVMISNDKDFLTTRVSYKLNLRGPSVTVQTACSTSLVAVQFAVQSLLDYQCDMALAGGVSVGFPHISGYRFQEGMILSPDGHCRAFDAQAQGTIAGEGTGLVVLKRLPDALADGDTIHAVIKGVAINNDGSGKVGYTAPSVEGQVEVIAMTHALSGIDVETISYIEAHGTGTTLGDPIEISALTQAFRTQTEGTNFCAIGSVKTNIGHLDAAAGVAGLIKLILALKHGEIPPSLHFERPNPQIDFSKTPFYVNNKLQTWNAEPRRAGISSFGIGGTNAHAVLEQAPVQPVQPSGREAHLLLLSAQSDTALKEMIDNLAADLQADPSRSLADVAYTLQNGRTPFPHRCAVVCRDTADAAQVLAANDPVRLMRGTVNGEETSVAFMFTGQGAQHVRMAQSLYQQEPVFQQALDTCAEILATEEIDLLDLLYPPADTIDATGEQLRQTANTQPALFAVEYALAQLWQSWGIQPDGMIGHSIGEYTAACLSGVFSLPDALRLVATRGRLMQSLPAGAMLSVPMPEAHVHALLPADLSIAAINAPSACVVSGETEAITQFQAQLAQQGTECRLLHTSHAFHSQMMEPILEEFAAAVAEANPQAPVRPFISNVSGTWITAAEATDPTYWSRHIRQAVHFADGIGTILREKQWFLLEVGPGHTLASLARRHPQATNAIIVNSLPQPKAWSEDSVTLLRAAGRLWLAGVPIDWPQIYAGENRRRVPLPGYSFQRQSYLVKPNSDGIQAAAHSLDLAVKQNPDDWFYTPSWQRSAPLFSAVTEPQTWLLFMDETGLGDRLAHQLSQAGHTVHRVYAGNSYAAHADGSFTLQPDAVKQYESLLQSVHADSGFPATILHLWNVTPVETFSFASSALNEMQNRGFYSALALAQAISGIDAEPMTLLLVSNGTQQVAGDEPLTPGKATILGPARVIPFELPTVAARHIDIMLPATPDDQKRVVGQLIGEAAAVVPDRSVAYRGRHRWVETFTPAALPKSTDAPPVLRRQGTYLITGGLGGIGLALAGYLAQEWQANLILLGRTPLPPETAWDSWLDTHDHHDPTSRKIQQLRQLTASGAVVRTAAADVANAEEMTAVWKQAVGQFGRIDGIIHAAGVGGGGLIALKTREMAADVLRPKVAGTAVLHTLMQTDPPDFLLLCSSINSILTTVGQADYCAANNFLDAYAHWQEAVPCYAVNWETWKEVGMAVNLDLPPHLQHLKEENLRKGISSAQGQEIFRRVLAAQTAQIVVSTRDFNHLLAQSRQLQDIQVLNKAITGSAPEPGTHGPQSAGGDRHPRPNLPTPYLAPTSDLEAQVVAIWEELLGIAPIGIHDSFFELGGHSLLATQVISRLRDLLQIEISLRNLFEATTAAELATRLEVILWTTQRGDESADYADDDEEREEFEI